MVQLAAVAITFVLLLGPASAAPVSEDQVHDIGSQLRCVVCQNLSVADSPSETAQQMRQIIRERLAAGQTPEQIRAYFVDKYGLWILLSPPRQGFNSLVWIMPFAALGLGLVVVAFVLRRWRRATVAADKASPSALDETMRERIRREMGNLEG